MEPIREFQDCTLYTFIDSAYLRRRSPTALARELCEGGSDIIQLRAKDWPKEQIERTARDLLPILRAHSVRFVVNDHLDIAQQIGADYCHLGQEDFFDSGWTHVSHLPLPTGSPRCGIGLSTHSPGQAHRAIRADPDYIAIGPVFSTATKPQAQPVTIEYVRWAAARVRIPWFAIGGITLENLPQVLAAGARRVCVVSAILNSSSVLEACRRFKQTLNSHR